MSRVRVARRIAAAAAVGSGGLGIVGGLAFGVLFAEVKLARKTVGSSEDDPPHADGRYGTAFADAPHPPITLAFLGDSTAAGLGVHRAAETPGALLASGLAAVAERPVDLVNVALSGARSDDLPRQVTLLEERGTRPDIAMIMIGANDVTNRVPPAESVRNLVLAVRRLRELGAEVVVGTCPDLGSVAPVYQPLRLVARRLSRQLAAAQTIAVVEEGGRTVSLGTLLGPEFAADPERMFGPDHYHPSAEGYATAAMALLPSLCAALGLWPEELPDAGRGDAVLPVAKAAVEAADLSGAEVAATEVGGEQGGRWALLRRRYRRRLPEAEDARQAAPEAV
ncbi:SGNH/GDSL hydrolase family protein [Streptomyces capparidis]